MVGRSFKSVRVVEGTRSVLMSEDEMLQRRLEQLLQGVSNTPRYKIAAMSEENKVIIADFLHEMTYKENAPPGTKGAYINNLFYLMKDCGDKSFKAITSKDLDLYMESHTKPAAIDPQQKWVATYNVRSGMFVRFFKWLYYPELQRSARKKMPRPDVIKNVSYLSKKEPTNVQGKDLWTPEEDRIFLKYCLDPRMCWYHTASDDTSARPGELLAKKFGDVKIKMYEGKTFGEMEVGRGGKTKSRPVPLIRSLPYYNQLAAANHDPTSYIFRSNRSGYKERNKPINEQSLYNLYQNLKTQYYPSLLERPDIPPEDKEIIREMLKKPWNPYIRRHTALTEKGSYMNEYELDGHAGWVKGSQMPKIYLHNLGASSSKTILAKHGIMPDKTMTRNTLLEPRYCPKCKEPNKPDTKFCVREGCGTPISPEAYYEIKQRDEAKEREVQELKQRLEDNEKARKKDMEDLESRIIAKLVKPVRDGKAREPPQVASS